ncbi:MAG: VTT domain-containing protein [Acidimicrobiia bacterium]
MQPIYGLLGALDPEKLIERGGLALLSLIVFAESGLLIGFFLPGDSLLFIAGFLTSDAGDHKLPALPIVLACVFVAAVVGDQVGYIFGSRTGRALFQRPDSRFFKKQNLIKAEAFFARHGAKTIVLARFVPIVRTFAPIVAGASSMKYRTFVTYNVVGGLLWAVGVTTAGHFLGQIDFIKNNIEVALIAIVAVSLIPVAIEFWRHRRGAASATH